MADFMERRAAQTSTGIHPDPAVIEGQVPSPSTEIDLPEPLHDYVLLEMRKREERTEGGIVVPDVINDEPMEGVVMEVGPEVRITSLHPGARVIFAKYAGFDIEVKRVAFRLIRAEDILAVWT